MKLADGYKIYTRNKGGTEYQTYSPLTLFADACTADASEAIIFNNAVENYFKVKSPENLETISNYLKKCIVLNEQLIELGNKAPLVQPILPLSQSLSNLSQELLLVLEGNKSFNTTIIEPLYVKCNSKEHADIELAICYGLKKMIDNLKN